MGITEISVKRPAAITMVILLLFGLGFMGYSRMGADLMPSINSPAITIFCSYAGAGPEDIKRDIVKPIESAVSGISGIDTLQSNCSTGSGNVTIRFTMETDMQTALMDVSKAVDRVAGRLPADADRPSIMKFDASDAPILSIAINGKIPYEELYNRADSIKQMVEKLPNVANVSLQGARTKRLYVKLDKTALEYYGVNISSLLNKLRSENTSSPLGQMKEEKNNQTVRYIGEFNDINEVKNLLVPIAGGSSIRLSDLAEIGFDYPDQDQMLRLDGENAIGIRISKQSDANIVEVADTVKKELDEIIKNLPKEVNLTIIDDSTTFIKSSLNEIRNNLIEGVITTALVLFMFLRNWRSSLIVLVAIPTSLVSAFFVMYINKFTLNIMSLMGMSLCVGILVDDSIVILENISRHLKMGKNPIDAAIEARKEIGLAAIAITLCDVVVFTPVALMSGMTGQYFREFGLTVAVATLFSLFVSFTVTPMLASKFLKPEVESEKEEHEKKPQNRFEKIMTALASVNDKYRKALIWSMNNRLKVLSVFTAVVIVCAMLIPMKVIKMESQPQTDDGRVNVNISLTPGSSITLTDAKVKQVEEYLKKGECSKYIRAFYSSVGNDSDKSTASMNIRLVPKGSRDKTPTEIADMIRTWGRSQLSGVNLSASAPGGLGGGGGMGGGANNISVRISGLDSNVLREIAFKVEEVIKSVKGIGDVSNPMRANESEIRVKTDRLALGEFGISATDITSVIRTGIQGATTGVYREGGNDYDIVVTFQKGQVATIYDIQALKVVTSSGKQISVSQVAEVNQGDAQRRITRVDRQDAVNVSANLQRGAILGTVSDEVKAKISELALPFGYTITYGGAQQQMSDQFSSLGQALIISIALVFMILVVLYESYLTPFVRMLSLPCAAIGALLALVISDNSLNLTTMIGVIMLDGLASKNGVLLIDYTNTLVKRGVPLREALVEAGTTRLRPIVMTSLTMVVGMLPSALSYGDGSELKTGMAIVVVGGMITSTILTPIIIPIVYTIIDDIKKHLDNMRARRKNSIVVGGSQYESTL